ncbi:MAG: hypothetical protein SGJ07_17080 [Rhodospirillaceae bacterium]|nr:hypothetical protein [Rhodospirillaceae bacterium]
MTGSGAARTDVARTHRIIIRSSEQRMIQGTRFIFLERASENGAVGED